MDRRRLGRHAALFAAAAVLYFVLDYVALTFLTLSHAPMDPITALIRSALCSSGSLAVVLSTAGLAARLVGMPAPADNYKQSAIVAWATAGFIGLVGIIGLPEPGIDPYPVADATFLFGLAILVLIAAYGYQSDRSSSP